MGELRMIQCCSRRKDTYKARLQHTKHNYDVWIGRARHVAGMRRHVFCFPLAAWDFFFPSMGKRCFWLTAWSEEFSLSMCCCTRTQGLRACGGQGEDGGGEAWNKTCRRRQQIAMFGTGNKRRRGPKSTSPCVHPRPRRAPQPPLGHHALLFLFVHGGRAAWGCGACVGVSISPWLEQ